MSEPTQTTLSYEAMSAELASAGYLIVHDDQLKNTFVVFIGHWETRFPAKTINDAIDKAWAHYQKEKQFQAMKDLLGEMYHGYVDCEPNYDIQPLKPFEDWLGRVRDVLGIEVPF